MGERIQVSLRVAGRDVVGPRLLGASPGMRVRLLWMPNSFRPAQSSSRRDTRREPVADSECWRSL